MVTPQKSQTLRDRTFMRLKQSIAGQESDGHAVFFYYTYPFYQSVTHVDLNAYFHDPKVTFDVQLEVLELLERCGSFAPDEGAVAECSALGASVIFDEHGFISVKPAELEELDDVLAIKPGDPYGDNYMRRALESLEYMLQHAPADLKVNPPVMHGPFTVAAQLRGISDMCMDILVEEDKAKALLEVCTETCIRFLKAAEKMMGGQLHHILVADDISSFLSPDQYREWVVPYYRMIFKEFPGVQRWLHNDASAEHLLDQIEEAGWDAWQYAPAIDSLKALERTQGKVSLMGGLNPVELQSLTEEETYNHCMEKLQYFGGKTKLVLAPGGSVNQVPIDNLKANLRAADTYKIG
ncbi:MAG: uroporphyrinogen decarboxylase family protein [Oscillospiraceae bacterium]|jgi:uroporphyrinogen-III decarboxylase|nr:uroporphyrinogen decarboxylase family protein [Oscillospiraceae bacterium]